jgi:hypothetical protein
MDIPLTHDALPMGELRERDAKGISLQCILHLYVILEQPGMSFSKQLDDFSTDKETDEDEKDEEKAEAEEYPEVAVGIFLLKTAKP